MFPRAAHLSHAVLVPVAALLLAACSSTYQAGWAYTPSPATAVTESGARVLATVHGVRNASDAEGLPESVEVRFRVEAPIDRAVTLQRESLHAVSSDMTDLPLVAFGPEGETTTVAGDVRIFTAMFGLPAGAEAGYDVDLDGLDVRWKALVGTRLATGSANFARVRYVGAHPYPHGPRWSFGVGYGHGHHGSGYGFGVGHHW